jgi:hypothetical protein
MDCDDFLTVLAAVTDAAIVDVRFVGDQRTAEFQINCYDTFEYSLVLVMEAQSFHCFGEWVLKSSYSLQEILDNFHNLEDRS